MLKYHYCADMAELADAPDSKSGYGDIVWVRFPLSALNNLAPSKFMKGFLLFIKHYNTQILSFQVFICFITL